MTWAQPKCAIWFLIPAILSHTVATNGLEFTSEPTSRLVKASDGRVVFRCEVSPSSADVRWLWKGQPVLPSRWIRVSRHKLTVHLNKLDKNFRVLKESENGSFQCEARFRGRVLVSAPAELIIAVLEEFPYQKDIHITANRGSSAVVPCQPPHSVPTVITEFLFNNATLISKTSERYLMMPSGSLQILDVQKEDTGEYVCIANNPYLAEKMEAQHKVHLRVTEPGKSETPRFLAFPHSKTVTVLGSNITLECAATGLPIPSVLWRKQHGHLPDTRYQKVAGNLLLFEVRREDEGIYFCDVENSLGSKISRHTLLEVQETPKITKYPKDAFLEAGQNLSLHCNAKGHPKPVVSWLHNGKSVHFASESKTKDTELVIHNVSHKQAGIYQCFASNDLGFVYAVSMVTVSHGNESADFDHDSEDYDDYDDDRSEMTSGKFHPSHGKHHTGHSENSPDESEPTRKKHRKKKKHKGVKLIPPSRPEVSRLSDTSVMVRWGVPRNDGLPILFFKVQYREIGRKGTQWMTIDEDIAAHIHSYAVTDLKNGGKYRFRIAAVYSNNDNKLGPNSAKFVLHKDLLRKKPNIGPMIVNAEPTSSTAITLYWEYADVDVEPIDGFFIYYRNTHSAGDYLKVTVLGANTRSHIITHLLPDTSYDIKTQCFNIAGTSEFSNIYTCKTKASENGGIRNRNSKSHHSEDDVLETFVTEPVSSKDSHRNVILNIVLGIISSAMFLAITIFLVIYVRQRSNRQPSPTTDDDDSGRGTPIKMGNGHSNGYIPVNQMSINVNPLSDLENVGNGTPRKTTQNGVVSNNNEIIQMQTFTSSEPLQSETVTDEEVEESTACLEAEEIGESGNAVILPSNTEATPSAPRSI